MHCGCMLVYCTCITVHYPGNVRSDVCRPTDMSSPTSTRVVINITKLTDTSRDVICVTSCVMMCTRSSTLASVFTQRVQHVQGANSEYTPMGPVISL